MRHGDLVRVRRPYRSQRSVLCVALTVTAEDIQCGINVPRPGLWLFRGYWYGKDALSIASYGKIEGNVGRRVGVLRSHGQAHRLLR